VDVAKEAIERIYPDACVRTMPKSVLEQEVGESLLDSDVIFCCTDGHASRALLNQLTYQYYLPMIDLGVEISVLGSRLDRVFGRVQYVAPGRPCLLCTGVIDPEEVRREFLTAEQIERDPYVRGSQVPQPAVASLNGTIASLAFTMLMSVAAGFPGQERYLTYRGLQQVIRPVEARAAARCIICSRSLGVGDRGIVNLWTAA
jgi:molybdopterin/thiamine biosynthesis adenylyltransferase